MTDAPRHSLELRSLVTPEGALELSLHEAPLPVPGPTEVLVRVEAAPINPSDLGLLLATADPTKASFSGTHDRPVVTFPLDAGSMRALAGRVGASMTVGNEGAGTVVAAGDAPEAQALVGRTVAVFGGSMYAQYRAVPVAQCLALPDGTPASEGAALFVNPMTVLGMLGTMRAEGHVGLIHTAAASNLGQMLLKRCLEEDVPLVNVVRRPEQAALLASLGAAHVCDTSAASFRDDLVAAIRETGAMLAFDAVGGGSLASQLLASMEAVASASATQYSRYGSSTRKQVYVYGMLDTGPTVLTRSFGFAWGLSGWLLTDYLATVGFDAIPAMQQQVLEGISTTFASAYGREVSLAEALQPAALFEYSKRATGDKFLVVPSAT